LLFYLFLLFLFELVLALYRSEITNRSSFVITHDLNWRRKSFPFRLSRRSG
jgi:hypothetical protein